MYIKQFLVLILFAVNSILSQEPPKTTTTPAKEVPKQELVKKEPGISFVKSEWKDIVAIATKEKKYIFIDAYTTWCSPCKWMDENVYNSKQAEDYFSSKFISVKMDMEKGEGPEIAKKYPVQYYPTLFFIDAKGNVVKKIVGYHDVDQLIKEAESAKLLFFFKHLFKGHWC